jgi:hypothetical protein
MGACLPAAVIPPGWGLTRNPSTKLWAATRCPPNTYGSEDPSYGLKTSLCRPCPPGTTTGSPSSVANPLQPPAGAPLCRSNGNAECTSPDACGNLRGWGWVGDTLARCPAGSWAAARSMAPCSECPTGRYTQGPAPEDPAWDGRNQDQLEDCATIPGWGVTGPSGNPDELDPVAECDIGTYGPGATITNFDSPTSNQRCFNCPGGKTTDFLGATTVDDCTRE